MIYSLGGDGMGFDYLNSINNVNKMVYKYFSKMFPTNTNLLQRDAKVKIIFTPQHVICDIFPISKKNTNLVSLVVCTVQNVRIFISTEPRVEVVYVENEIIK